MSDRLTYGHNVQPATLACTAQRAWSEYLNAIVPSICDASQLPPTLHFNLQSPGFRIADVPCVLSTPFGDHKSTGTLADVISALDNAPSKSSYGYDPKPTTGIASFHTYLNDATFLADLLVVARVASSGILSFDLLGLKAKPVSGHTLALL